MSPVGLCLTKNRNGLSNLNLGGSGIRAPGFERGILACLGLNSRGRAATAGSSKSEMANRLSMGPVNILSELFSLLKIGVAGYISEWCLDPIGSSPQLLNKFT